MKKREKPWICRLNPFCNIYHHLHPSPSTRYLDTDHDVEAVSPQEGVGRSSTTPVAGMLFWRQGRTLHTLSFYERPYSTKAPITAVPERL